MRMHPYEYSCSRCITLICVSATLLMWIREDGCFEGPGVPMHQRSVLLARLKSDRDIISSHVVWWRILGVSA